MIAHINEGPTTWLRSTGYATVAPTSSAHHPSRHPKQNAIRPKGIITAWNPNSIQQQYSTVLQQYSKGNQDLVEYCCNTVAIINWFQTLLITVHGPPIEHELVQPPLQKAAAVARPPEPLRE